MMLVTTMSLLQAVTRQDDHLPNAKKMWFCTTSSEMSLHVHLEGRPSHQVSRSLRIVIYWRENSLCLWKLPRNLDTSGSTNHTLREMCNIRFKAYLVVFTYFFSWPTNTLVATNMAGDWKSQDSLEFTRPESIVSTNTSADDEPNCTNIVINKTL